MKKNLGLFDRIIRILFAAGVAILYFANITTGTFGIILMIAGGVLLITGFVNFCPIYFALGLSSKGKMHRVVKENKHAAS